MAIRENEFEVRIGKLGRDGAPILGPIQGAIGRVKRGRGLGPKPARVARTGLQPHFRKGAAKVAKPRGFSGSNRRVVVKTRIVSHGASGLAPLRSHVAYLARDTPSRTASPELERQVDYLSRETEQGRAQYDFYDGDHEGVNAKALTAGWTDDVRHFRLIISPEDGAALGDLQPFVREVMADLEQRLGTKLEWAAVDHWDTINPHAHVLVRGRRADGQALVIPNKILTQEIRERAGEIVTRALGPRPYLSPDLVLQRERELVAPKLTPLDREIIARAKDNLLDLPERGRTDLIARLDRLEIWDLAARRGAGSWEIAENLGARLTALGEKTEIMRMLEQVRGLALNGFDVLEADRSAPVLGRLVHVGMVDELSERTIAVIEDAYGRLRYAGFERADELAPFTGAVPGAIVEFRPRQITHRPADEAVARVAEHTGGLYSPDHHTAVDWSADPALVAGNIRRLEAMRRANLVGRQPDGVFEIAADHRDRGRRFEEKRLAKTPVEARIASYWRLDEQENALAPTQLDRVLAHAEPTAIGTGRFAQEFEAALMRRRLFLIEQGLMGEHDQALSQSALDRLVQHELHTTARRLEAELGRPVLTELGAQVEGVYARRIDLAQGRVAMIWQDRTAQLVPWRPALERFAGREVTGQVRSLGLSPSISWSLARGRARTIDLPPM